MVSRNEPSHAVVIGSSLGGMFAARVLSEHYDRVTVIERDALPEAPEHRACVPQSHHAHALLAAGQRVIERHFPGIMADLVEGGASRGGMERLMVVSPFGKLHPASIGEDGVLVSRYRLEWTVRRRLFADPRVRLLAETEATGPLATADRSRIVGVELRRRGGSNEVTQLTADLVVDASGRASKVPEWLRALGYEAPPEESINSGIGYASRFFARPPGFSADWDGLIINARPPDNPRAGLILPVEGDRWHVTVGNFAGHYPDSADVTSDAGFLAYAAMLPDPTLRDALRAAVPLTPVKLYRTPTNRLRRYEDLARAPAGLIVTGDAVCAFNPIYGQGMSASALASLTLAETLPARRPGWEREFQRKLAQTVAGAWFIATSEDLRWSGVQLTGAARRPGAALLRRYVDELLQAARTDPQVSRAYMRMLNLLDPPAALLRPGVVARVAGATLRRALGWSPDGAPAVAPLRGGGAS